jgi:HAMP domain-containing protein
MSEQGLSPARRTQRRQYLLDHRLQLTVTIQILGALAGVAILYVIGIHVLPGDDVMANLNVDETRSFLSRAAAIYFALAVAILAVIALMVTHRIAGPASVMRKAVRAMENGNFEARVGLRRSDYLQPLAEAIADLQRTLRETEAHRKHQLRDLNRCLEESDLEAARELLVQLGLGEEASRPMRQET